MQPSDAHRGPKRIHKALGEDNLMPQAHGGVATALECHHRYLRWLVPTLEKFPRSQKFLLGDRIQTLGLDILESLVDATFSRERSHKLQSANINIEKTRHLLRLCCDLGYLDRRRHEHAIRLLHDTGTKIGAWQKSTRKPTSSLGNMTTGVLCTSRPDIQYSKCFDNQQCQQRPEQERQP